MKSRRQVLSDMSKRLAIVGVETARLDAQALLLWVCGIDRETLLKDPDKSLSEEEWGRYQAAIERRQQHEPVSRICGYREFWGLEFSISPDVLDPRPDSEILVEVALKRSQGYRQPKVLDLGTGSGCLLLAYLSERPDATGLGIDVSIGALSIAQKNATHLGFGGRAQFETGHWSMELDQQFSVILCNPPYIDWQEKATLAPEVSGYDPDLALYSGQAGLQSYIEILADLKRICEENAIVAFECGWQQATEIYDLLDHAGYEAIEINKDLGGHARVVSAINVAAAKKN